MISLPNVQIIEYNNKETELYCVLGCLRNERGLQIRDEMLKWIQLKYHTWIVYQDYPGSLYEYPALKFAQEISLSSKKPVLYLHTKGAFNDNPSQYIVRALWWQTFFNLYTECIKYLKEYDVVCPFTGATKITWYNGFIATPTGWSNVNIQPETDRYIFESLYLHREIKPTKIHGIISNTANTANEVSNIVCALMK